jgi:hypothetical protein
MIPNRRASTQLFAQVSEPAANEAFVYDTISGLKKS